MDYPTQTRSQRFKRRATLHNVLLVGACSPLISLTAASYSDSCRRLYPQTLPKCLERLTKHFLYFNGSVKPSMAICSRWMILGLSTNGLGPRICRYSETS